VLRQRHIFSEYPGSIQCFYSRVQSIQLALLRKRRRLKATVDLHYEIEIETHILELRKLERSLYLTQFHDEIGLQVLAPVAGNGR
jgi:hypothetical protein